MKRLSLVALSVAGLILCVPATASALSWFSYVRTSNPINGSLVPLCDQTGCVGQTVRAGSGNGGTNQCLYGNWIPTGTYSASHSDNFNGGLIFGRVWQLSDHYCSSNGNWRTGLFVHSEETSGQGQTNCGYPNGDSPTCWEGVNDYYSLGCIKVARQPVTGGYSDLGRIDAWHHSMPVTQVRVWS
jgi:hypothetical protein